MSTGKKVSTTIIILIVTLIYFFGYNYEYNNSVGIPIILFLLLMFSYIGLTLSTYERIVGENPGNFFFQPWKKIKYVFLSAVSIVTLLVLLFATLIISFELSKQRKKRFLDSSETNKVVGIISRLDSIPLRYGKRPVAYLNYKIENKDFEFELRNENGMYKRNQKIKVKYSLVHPDMFEITK